MGQRFQWQGKIANGKHAAQWARFCKTENAPSQETLLGEFKFLSWFCN